MSLSYVILAKQHTTLSEQLFLFIFFNYRDMLQWWFQCDIDQIKAKSEKRSTYLEIVGSVSIQIISFNFQWQFHSNFYEKLSWWP